MKVLELVRELTWLSKEHPRFAPQINKLMMRVRLQARPRRVKQETILDALRPSQLCIQELTEETMLDRDSLLPELDELVATGTLEVVDSQGRTAEERQRERLHSGTGSGGLWTRYWRVRGHATGHQGGARRDNQVEGTSQR